MRGHIGLARANVSARAFLWEHGIMTDLNTLVGAGNLDVLLSAQDISDAGQIAGRVRDHATGQILAFVATPTGRADLATIERR